MVQAAGQQAVTITTLTVGTWPAVGLCMPDLQTTSPLSLGFLILRKGQGPTPPLGLE
jgi:hypothetical protein